MHSYDEDEMVEDPKLAEHLAHFGINIASMTKVRSDRRKGGERKERRKKRRERREAGGREHLAACTYIPTHSHPHTPTPPHTHTRLMPQ